MFNIRKSETYSWDAVNNISKEQVEEFIKLLQYQLNLDVVKPCSKSNVLPFEIADKSTEKELTWHDAVAYVKSLGDGWRLPTRDELDLIYNSKNDFIGYYWSSTEDRGNSACVQYFSNGGQGVSDKSASYYVRAVRYI